MWPPDPNRLRDVIETLANALQSAVLLSSRLRRELETSGQEAAALHEAVTRAALTLRSLHPNVEQGKELL